MSIVQADLAFYPEKCEYKEQINKLIFSKSLYYIFSSYEHTESENGGSHASLMMRRKSIQNLISNNFVLSITYMFIRVIILLRKLLVII
jgi:hypothetical protein